MRSRRDLDDLALNSILQTPTLPQRNFSNGGAGRVTDDVVRNQQKLKKCSHRSFRGKFTASAGDKDKRVHFSHRSLTTSPPTMPPRHTPCTLVARLATSRTPPAASATPVTLKDPSRTSRNPDCSSSNNCNTQRLEQRQRRSAARGGMWP